MPSNYTNLESRPWDEVLEMNRSQLPRPPFSAHIPLGLPMAKDMVILDGALNASVLQMPPAMRNGDIKDKETLHRLRTRTLSFCPDTAPFIMDFHHAKIQRVDGDLPQFKATYYAYYTLYTLEYAMGEKGRLAIRATIRNENARRERKSLWLKLSHPLEYTVYDYHYVTYHYTANNFPRFDDSCTFHDNALWNEGNPVARITPGDFQPTWHDTIFFKDSDYTDNKFYWDSPYFVHPEFRIYTAKNMLELSIELDPNQESSFEITLDTLMPGGLPEELPSFKEASEWNRKEWLGMDEGHATVDFGDRELNNRFKSIERVSKQLLFDMDWPGKGHIPFTCQGGTSERFYIWVWEALCCFKPLMRLGHLKETRDILEFIFSLQDGGFPPQGEFVPAKGAIGTTGPKWSCITGAALTWASEYYLYSQDDEFARRHLDQMALACSWITAQIRAPHPEGYPYPGLMPKCCATDADYGRLIIFTDNWSCRGMELAAEILTRFKHPEAEKYTRIAAEYRKDLMECIEDLTQPDGYVRRQIDDSGIYCQGFVNCDSFTFLAYAGTISLHDERLRNFVRWCEENSCQDFFFGPMTPHLIYIGTGEQMAAIIQLANGEYKKAWSAMQTFERYGCSQDCYLTQERFDVDDPEHASWQPNASNNGRMMDMELARLYLETDRQIMLLCGFAPFELQKKGRHFAIHGLHTQYGRLDLDAEDGVVDVHWEKEPKLPIILPEGWKLRK